MQEKLDVLDFRQGDVGFVWGRVPADAKRIPVKLFAFGEVTCHSHRVPTEWEELVAFPYVCPKYISVNRARKF